MKRKSREDSMVLTRDSREAIRERVERDPAFREALFTEGIECLLAGDIDTGKAVLRDCINASLAFRNSVGLLTNRRRA